MTSFLQCVAYNTCILSSSEGQSWGLRVVILLPTLPFTQRCHLEAFHRGDRLLHLFSLVLSQRVLVVLSPKYPFSAASVPLGCSVMLLCSATKFNLECVSLARQRHHTDFTVLLWKSSAI